MKRLAMILLMGLSCMSNLSYAGNGDLTVGGTLEMTSNANGFLPPRMSTSARGNLAPSPGMLIYNTDDNAYNYYTSSGWKSIAASLPVHDNTGASSDYALAVGETAKITYSFVTSVPLHIATVQGEYEVIIKGDRSISVSNDNWCMLKPNNIIYSGAFQTIHDRLISPNVRDDWFAYEPAIMLTEGRLSYAHLNISTETKSKCIQMKVNGENTSSGYRKYERNINWNDSSTVWASLGTISLPYAQSGTIIIRRIL